MPHRDQAVPLVFYTEKNERRVVGVAKMAIDGAETRIDAVITDAAFAKRISPGLDEISIGRMTQDPPVYDDREGLDGEGNWVHPEQAHD